MVEPPNFMSATRFERRCELCGCCAVCCLCEYGQFEDGVPACFCDELFDAEPAIERTYLCCGRTIEDGHADSCHERIEGDWLERDPATWGDYDRPMRSLRLSPRSVQARGMRTRRLLNAAGTEVLDLRKAKGPTA